MSPSRPAGHAGPDDPDRTSADGAAAADVSDLPYEAARDELVDVVRRLESGSADLEESLALWERGEALAGRCQQVLDGAVARLEARTGGAGADAGE